MVSSFQKCSLVMESLKKGAGESVTFNGKCAIHNCHNVVVCFLFLFFNACMYEMLLVLYIYEI